MKEQITINSLDFAQKFHEIRGTIPPRDLGRLSDVLFSHEGKLDFLLQGGVYAQGRPELKLHVEGELMLACQRCMGLIRHPIDLRAHFVIVPNEDMMPAPEEEQDDVDYLVADQHFDVVALIEDEILLGMPMAPLHEVAECGVDAATAKEQKESPFKVLQGLKLSKG
jgi:uncharacterized protein